MTNKPEIAMVKKIIAGFVSLLLGRKVGLVWGEHAGMLPNGNIMLPSADRRAHAHGGPRGGPQHAHRPRMHAAPGR